MALLNVRRSTLEPCGHGLPRPEEGVSHRKLQKMPILGNLSEVRRAGNELSASRAPRKNALPIETFADFA
jgi:hypothetical protein